VIGEVIVHWPGVQATCACEDAGLKPASCNSTEVFLALRRLSTGARLSSLCGGTCVAIGGAVVLPGRIPLHRIIVGETAGLAGSSHLRLVVVRREVLSSAAVGGLLVLRLLVSRCVVIVSFFLFVLFVV
jgi:hypothetical protein